MRLTNKGVILPILATAFTLLSNPNLSAHEPLFGLGPHTIYQYGFALESEVEKGDHGWANHVELLYGITPDWAVTLAAPYLFENDDRRAGWGDLSLRSKFRFYRKDMPGASNQAALHAGVKFPTGEREENRGSGTTDYFVGLSVGRESRRHYFFAGARYQVNGVIDNLGRGNQFEFDAAYGIRPWKLEYRQPDTVFLVEFIGELMEKNFQNNQSVINSGGNIFSIAPGLLFSYRNVMLKAGIKIPLLENLNGEQETPDTEYVFGLELHLPPLF